MSWIGNGIMTKNQGEMTNHEIGHGGHYLTLAGRILNADSTLGGYFQHRRLTKWWYASEEDAMTALLTLAAQEEVQRHAKKRELDLRKPGVIEAFAWVEERRWQ